MARKKESGRALLKKHLFLNDYICNLFGLRGFNDFKTILYPSELTKVPEGFDEDGRSSFFKHLFDLPNLDPHLKTRLEFYDNNIYGYMKKINEKRERPITLKYFQYLAVLFTDIYLDRYFENPKDFQNAINEFTYPRRMNKKFLFNRHDMRKLAFWMATGSGKTILLHINYYQFLHYNDVVYSGSPHRIDYDSIMLITPSSGLTKQHADEAETDGVSHVIYENVPRNSWYVQEDKPRMKMLNIQRIKPEGFWSSKKSKSDDKALSIEVTEFGKKNIVFVDEGHRGATGETWLDIRYDLAEEGFTFEYSATFGEAVKTDASDYGKAIIFDYEYRLFHKDGFGKDYRILNLDKGSYGNPLFIANVLTFYEQKLLYREFGGSKYQEYNVSNPLWIFVGSTVDNKDSTSTSDVFEILSFFDYFFKEKEDVIGVIDKILKGGSGLIDKSSGRDLFSPDFPEEKLKYLKSLGFSAEEIYNEILRVLFYADHAGVPLVLVNLKGAAGEIALKAGWDNSLPFGVINISGDDKFFSDAGKRGFATRSDSHTSSLFNGIIEDSSQINILIGARKFILGWNSFRVSNIGLMNVGASEGPTIIQLFGRGVRLWGKDFCLKRSKYIEDDYPKYLPIMETLNIFGINSNYMDVFREELRKAGIGEKAFVDLEISIDTRTEYLDKELKVPFVDLSAFPQTEVIEITGDENVSVSVDIRPRVEVLESFEKGLESTSAPSSIRLSSHSISILNWDSIYFQLLDFKMKKGWYNLTFSKDALIRIMNRSDSFYSLLADSSLSEPSFKNRWMVENAVVSLLSKYIERAYKDRLHDWELNRFETITLAQSNSNLNFNKYILTLEDSKEEIKRDIEKIRDEDIESFNKGNRKSKYINNVYFEKHLYQPLLSESNHLERILPVGLNPNEIRFVELLKDYLSANSEDFKDKEIFLLRNLPRRGVGFPITNKVYPDFILWMLDNNQHRIIFTDPHGLGHAYNGQDDKVELATRIKRVEEILRQTPGNSNLHLDSFVFSIKPFSEIRGNFNTRVQKDLEDMNILFLDEGVECIRKMFSKLN